MKGHQKATSLWKNICKTAKTIYDGVSVGLGLFVTYFLKYLVVFLVLVLLISITHRATCEIPLVRYYHPPCTTVWTPTPLSTDAQQDYALSQIANPLQRHSETLNQLQENEYFHKIPITLIESSRWMRQMKTVLQHTSVEIPSRENTVKSLEVYETNAKKIGWKLSKVWAKIPSTVNRVLHERTSLLRKIENVHTDNSTLTSVVDIPGLLWSFVAPLLGRPILTPHQARQVDEEHARISLLKMYFPRLRTLLDGLANDIASALKDFDVLVFSLDNIQAYLFNGICEISISRDLLSQAESHPYYRFRSFLGFQSTQSFDLRFREAQLQLLSTTNATVIVTVRELAVMERVIRKLSDDMDNMMDILDLYESSLNDGKISIDGILQAVKIGIDTLVRGRDAYIDKERQRHEKESRESDERWAQATTGLMNLADTFGR